ncbi:MAG: UDP-N-acetylmuramate--L-alanine ligase, partial [Candidatus Paceibacterota bacterium]
SFKDADEVILLPIYPAREVDDGTVSSDTLYQKMRDVHGGVSLAKDNEDALRLIRIATEGCDENCVVLTMGAGDAYKIGEAFLKDDGLKS